MCIARWRMPGEPRKDLRERETNYSRAIIRFLNGNDRGVGEGGTENDHGELSKTLARRVDKQLKLVNFIHWWS